MPDPVLRLVNTDTGELVETDRRLADLEDKVAGLEMTIAAQARKMGSQARQLAQYDPEVTPQPKEITRLIERWRTGSGRKKAKIGVARVKLVKARLADGYSITSGEELPDEPTLELAVDGLCAYPYRIYDRRYATGKPANLDNDLEAALKDEKHVEAMARLGYKARRAGWTPGKGWPA